MLREGNQLFELFKNQNSYVQRSSFFINEIEEMISKYNKLNEEDKFSEDFGSTYGINWAFKEPFELTGLMFEYIKMLVDVKLGDSQ